uniref:Protein-tyrosine sulfotransferase n=1 Tax=Schistosoma mansoni TaxID=6183 RepID=A0A3Q0KP89_SCHMA
MDRLVESGITATVLNDAAASFIATLIKEMGPRAPRLCHRDTESFDYLEDLNILFPKGKFIHIVRDGRATVASKIARNINSNYTSENITDAILIWDEDTTQILEDCEYIGSEKCLTLRYECLVLNPLREIQKVLQFLSLPWDEKLLKYGTDFSRIDQLIHRNSLDAWSKEDSLLSEEYIKFMNENSLALKQLGYLTDEIPPNYATICNN